MHEVVDGPEVTEEDSHADIATAPTQRDAGSPPALRAADLEGLAEQAKVFEALFDEAAEPLTLGRYVVLDTLGAGGMGIVLRAFDRDLDRQVALKVLHEGLGPHETARLRREAQAMAKLSHPNVVQVYEVGMVGGQSFVAMELIRGKTLRQWMRTEPRPGWRACVEVHLQLGAGLAAAHERGLVHRDFKPGNAIIDEQGRARVLDFGLARQFGADVQSESESGGASPAIDRARTGRHQRGRSGESLTRTGTVVGTPAYMPPEQMIGGEVDARSDQFSFCVSLWESVYGERPFEGRTLAALIVAVRNGEVRSVPKGSAVPARLRAVLLRGLATEPQERWASMDELLDVLRRLVRPRGRRRAAAGLTAGLAALGGGLALAQYVEVMNRCTGAVEQLEGTWDEERREAVGAAVLGTELSYAADTWERLEPGLDDYARAWASKHTEVCEASRVRDEQSTAVMDLRMECLREHRVALDAAVKVLVAADATVTRNAVKVLGGLPALDRCDDVERLRQRRQRLPPPVDPRRAEQVDELRQRLAEVAAQGEAGRYVEALEAVQPVVAGAEALGYAPLLAEALRRRGWLYGYTAKFTEAERDLERAFELAAEHGHDVAVVEAVSALTVVVGRDLARHERGLGWGKTALALSKGPEVEPTAVAVVLSNISIVLSAQGKPAEALEHQRRALVVLEDAFGPDHPKIASVLTNMGIVLRTQGAFDEALDHHRRALAIHRDALGSAHPKVARTLVNIASVLAAQGKLEDALEHQRRALTVFEAALGSSHPMIAAVLGNTGNMLHARGELPQALEHYRRALSIFERSVGPAHPHVASAVNSIGVVLAEQGESEEALEHYRRALTLRKEALGPTHPDVAQSLHNIGAVLHGRGELSEAAEHYRQSLAIREQVLGSTHPDLGDSLVKLAQLALTGQDFEAARTHAERAVSVREAGEVAPRWIAEARFVLARALWSDPTHRSRARELARSARRTYVEHGADMSDDIAEIDAWLDARPSPVPK